MRLLPRLSKEQVRELELFAKETTDIKAFNRSKAILLLNNQTDLTQVTGYTGYSRSQIFSLRNQYSKKGLKAVETQRKGEPKRLLTKGQLQEITGVLQEVGSPLKLGFHTPFWTTGMLAGYVKDTYGVIYKSKTSYYLLFKKAVFHSISQVRYQAKEMKRK